MAKQMVNKRLDLNQLSKRIADIATGQVKQDPKPDAKKDVKKGK